MNYKRKPKPQNAGATCPGCGSWLKDYELFNGCFTCSKKENQMSKVEAYKCNYCNEIKEASAIVGVSETVDIFDRLKSYPVINNPQKATVHLCGECYDRHVIQPADYAANPKRNREENENKREEFAYILRHATVSRSKLKKDLSR